MPELYLSGKWLGKEKPRCHVKHLQSLVKHCLQVFSPPWKKQCPPQSPSVAANHYITGSDLPQPPAATTLRNTDNFSLLAPPHTDETCFLGFLGFRSVLITRGQAEARGGAGNPTFASSLYWL